MNWNLASQAFILLKKLRLKGWWSWIVEALVMLLIILIGLAISFPIIRCLTDYLFSPLSPSLLCVQISITDEDLRVSEP